MKNLAGRTALITGASSGIGRASALLLAGMGVNVVLAGRRQLALESLVKEVVAAGGKGSCLPGDVRDEAYQQALVAMAVEEYGGLDIAFNNAGTLGDLVPIQEMSNGQWQEVIATNLTSAFLGARFQVPAMMKQGGGSLIFTSSFVGYSAGIAGMTAYSASKAGLIGMVKSLAVELAESGIRVNAILPGGTKTPMSETFITSPDAEAFMNRIHALGRQASPEEIAQSVLYLASDLSSFSTGTALLADGGVSVKRS